MNILTENTVTEENFERDPIVSIATTVTGDIGQVITMPTEAANADDLEVNPMHNKILLGSIPLRTER
jgi:hypothetical protein